MKKTFKILLTILILLSIIAIIFSINPLNENKITCSILGNNSNGTV